MSNTFYQVQGVQSDAIASLSLCPSLDTVVAEFVNGGRYLYQGVDGDAIADALFGLDSLGGFVNQNCKTQEVVTHKLA